MLKVSTEGATPADLADGSAPHVLELVWSIMAWYYGKPVRRSSDSASDAIPAPLGALRGSLMRWVNRHLTNRPDLGTVTDLSLCLANGQVLLALLTDLDSSRLFAATGLPAVDVPAAAAAALRLYGVASGLRGVTWCRDERNTIPFLSALKEAAANKRSRRLTSKAVDIPAGDPKDSPPKGGFFMATLAHAATPPTERSTERQWSPRTNRASPAMSPAATLRAATLTEEEGGGQGGSSASDEDEVLVLARRFETDSAHRRSAIGSLRHRMQEVEGSSARTLGALGTHVGDAPAAGLASKAGYNVAGYGPSSALPAVERGPLSELILAHSREVQGLEARHELAMDRLRTTLAEGRARARSEAEAEGRSAWVKFQAELAAERAAHAASRAGDRDRAFEEGAASTEPRIREADSATAALAARCLELEKELATERTAGREALAAAVARARAEAERAAAAHKLAASSYAAALDESAGHAGHMTQKAMGEACEAAAQRRRAEAAESALELAAQQAAAEATGLRRKAAEAAEAVKRAQVEAGTERGRRVKAQEACRDAEAEAEAAAAGRAAAEADVARLRAAAVSLASKDAGSLAAALSERAASDMARLQADARAVEMEARPGVAIQTCNASKAEAAQAQQARSPRVAHGQALVTGHLAEERSQAIAQPHARDLERVVAGLRKQLEAAHAERDKAAQEVAVLEGRLQALALETTAKILAAATKLGVAKEDRARASTERRVLEAKASRLKAALHDNHAAKLALGVAALANPPAWAAPVRRLLVVCVTSNLAGLLLFRAHALLILNAAFALTFLVASLGSDGARRK